MPHAELLDDELVRAAKGGEREAFDTLVERHGASVLRCVSSFARDAAEADDLAQEAFLQAYRRLETFSSGTHFKAWLLRIAYRTGLHSRRKKSVVNATEQEQLERVAARSEVQSVGELEDAVRAVVETLPKEQQTVVQLRFVEELSHAEIAEITESEVATVRWRLFQARQTLQKRLQAWAPDGVKEGGTE